MMDKLIFLTQDEIKCKYPNVVYFDKEQHYQCTRDNYLLCIDETQLGNYGWLCCLVDASSRAVKGYVYSYTKLSSVHVVSLVEQVHVDLLNLNMNPMFYIHSDCGSIFRSFEYVNRLSSLGIVVSYAHSKRLCNQFIERFHSTVKNHLRVLLDPQYMLPAGTKLTKELDPLFYSIVPEETFMQMLDFVIHHYNNSEHKYNMGLTPIQACVAYYVARENNIYDSSVIPLYTSRQGVVPIRRRQVLKEAKKAIYNTFLEDVLDFKRNTYPIMSKKLEITNNFNESFKEFNKLYNQELYMKSKLDAVLDSKVTTLVEEKLKEKGIDEYEKRSSGRAMRKPLQVHEIITEEDLLHLVSVTVPKYVRKALPQEQQEFYKHREVAAFSLLYVFGLSINQLLSLKIEQIYDLMNKRKCELTLPFYLGVLVLMSYCRLFRQFFFLYYYGKFNKFINKLCIQLIVLTWVVVYLVLHLWVLEVLVLFATYLVLPLLLCKLICLVFFLL